MNQGVGIVYVISSGLKRIYLTLIEIKQLKIPEVPKTD